CAVSTKGWASSQYRTARKAWRPPAIRQSHQRIAQPFKDRARWPPSIHAAGASDRPSTIRNVAAYETLPAALRGLADQLWALHSNVYDYGATQPNATARQAQRYATMFKSTVYETEHPVVLVHPLTGERAIVLGSFVRRLLGVSSADSAHLFAMRQDHVTRLQNMPR